MVLFEFGLAIAALFGFSIFARAFMLVDLETRVILTTVFEWTKNWLKIADFSAMMH